MHIYIEQMGKFYKWIINIFLLFLLCNGNIAISEEKIAAYGLTLTTESSPIEVAKLLVKGLDNEDKGLLTKLVAVKYEMKEMEKIFHKYGRKSNLTPEKVAIVVSSGWLATYLSFQSGKTILVKEKIEGNNAIVYATGINLKGEKQILEIKMVREDNWWKVQSGLKVISGDN